MADPTADLTARLRGRHVKRMGELDQADWICGGHHGGYPPEWPCQTVVLLDALDAADAENARLTAERDEALAEVAQLRDERSAALALLDIHAKDPFHPDVRAALRGECAVLAVSEEATDAEGGPRG